MSEKLWYPEFGLKGDPFQYNDFCYERSLVYEGLPRIKTEQIKRIEALTGACFIVGAAGVGKSTALYEGSQELKKVYKNVVSVVSPLSLISFYDNLFDETNTFYRKNGGKEIFDREILGRAEEEWIEVKQTRRKDQILVVCDYPRCTMRKRCKVACREINHSNFSYLLSGVEQYCPLKVEVVNSMVKHLDEATGNSTFRFLIDVPDDLSSKEVRDFKSTVRLMQRYGNTLIIMATHEQHRLLEKSDYFRRIKPFDFIQMTNEELEMLFHKRVEWQKAEGDFEPLLTGDALELVVKKSIRNPRFMIGICREIMLNMKVAGRDEPADKGFVEEASKSMKLFTLDDYIRMLVKRYKGQGKQWVTVQQSIKDLKEWYNVDITDKKLGWRLKALYEDKQIYDYKGGPARGLYSLQKGEED